MRKLYKLKIGNLRIHNMSDKQALTALESLEKNKTQKKYSQHYERLFDILKGREVI